MEINKYKIGFFLRNERKLVNNESPIYVRIVVNAERTVTSINKSINESIWDIKKQRAKGNSLLAQEVNSYLEVIRNKFYACYIEAERDNRRITATEIKKLFYREDDQYNYPLLTYVRECVVKVEKLKGIDYAPSTIQRYKTFLQILETFLKLHGKSDIALDMWDGQLTSEFLYYLKTERNCKHNSAAKYIRSLGKMLRDAIKAGLVSKSEAELNLSIKWEEVNTEYLTREELERIINKEIVIERMQVVRDVFVFCCFTGLSFIDAKQLTDRHIERGNQDTVWIVKNRQKTDQKAHIPLLDIPLKIIAKYENNPYCVKHKVLLPIMSNQKYNAYLKELADICGIKKNLVSHMARHTFATTVTLANNISMESVSKMLGHSDIKMTKHYAKILDKTVEVEMKKISKIWQLDDES